MNTEDDLQQLICKQQAVLSDFTAHALLFCHKIKVGTFTLRIPVHLNVTIHSIGKSNPFGWPDSGLTGISAPLRPKMLLLQRGRAREYGICLCSSESRGFFFIQPENGYVEGRDGKDKEVTVE